ncbi:MAG TPA: alpha/beta fold hydrolase [Nitriliruptorales bacterium]
MPSTARDRRHDLRWHRTTLDGRVVSYGEAGDGPPVVFLHGWGLNARTYAKAWPRVVRAGARVVAPALPGFGSSDPLPGELTFEKLARWLDDLLDHLAIDEPAFLVGHSFGGGVAVATAWHCPERVRSLVLVNSIGGSVWKEGDRGARSLRDRPLWDWGLHLPAELTSRGYGRALPVVARDFLANVVRNPGNLWRAGSLARHADLRGELADLCERGIPVTVLWGDQDRLIPEAAFVATCEAAGAPGDVMDRAGHSWLLADPEGFGEVITNSLTVHALLARRAGTAP